MTRSPRIPETTVPRETAHYYAQRVRKLVANKENEVSQEQFGIELGKIAAQKRGTRAEDESVSQPTISRLIRVLEDPTMPLPGADLIWKLAQYYGDDYRQVMAGILPASEGADMGTSRGRAADILSGDPVEYPDNLLEALGQKAIDEKPDGHEAWSHVLWIRWFERQKKLWDDGDIALPKLGRKKR